MDEAVCPGCFPECPVGHGEFLEKSLQSNEACQICVTRTVWQPNIGAVTEQGWLCYGCPTFSNCFEPDFNFQTALKQCYEPDFNSQTVLNQIFPNCHEFNLILAP